MNSLTGRFLEHARHRPQATALIWRKQRTSYAELAEQAFSVRQQVAGLSPGPIGILSGKSSAAIALVLGCLLAGRRILIPSPTLPSQTAGALFDQAGCAHVLSADAHLAVSHPDLVDLVVTPDRVPVPSGALATVPPDAVSFMLTTSGSTGLPKIVPLTVGAVDRFADWAAATFDIGPDSRVLNYAPLNFDLCLLDIWTTLAHGGSVVMVDPDHAANGAHLADLVATQEVHVVQAVPMFYELLRDACVDGRSFESVRQVLFTGDAIRPGCLAALPALFPNARFFNVYGCTETNDSFVHEVKPGETSLQLGEPLPGVHHLLAVENQTVLIGPGVGELYVATPFQTTGYLATANEDKFLMLDDGEDTRRYFRSGDLVRRHPDGSLTLEGRTDFRVKVRGQQVDVQQVEQVMLTHGRVAEAAVVAVPDPLAGHRLHAQVRRMPGSGLNSLVLRRFCADRLPAIAIPSTWAIAESPLPKTSTGKVDRNSIKNNQLKVSKVDHTAAITKFVVQEFLPDVSAGELSADYDLLAGGVIDSLGLLKVIAWLEDTFSIDVDDVELSPESFRTIDDINTFIGANSRSLAGQN